MSRSRASAVVTGRTSLPNLAGAGPKFYDILSGIYRTPGTLPKPSAVMSRRQKAQPSNERGNELLQRGKLQEALGAYQQAADADPGWGTPLYNLGLVYKRLGRWEESLEFNRRAT